MKTFFVSRSVLAVTSASVVLAPFSPCAVAADYAPRHSGLAYQVLGVAAQPRADFLSGRIMDESGKPIQGATVDAFHWYPGNETKTDATGGFRLDNSALKDKRYALDPTEKIEVTFSAPGYTPRYIVAQPLGKLTAPVVLTKSTFVFGTVRDGAGHAVAGAQVRAVAGPFEGDGVVITERPYLTRSDALGRYKLFLPGDSYELFVRGAAGVERLPQVALAQDKALLQNIALRPGVLFRARVVDSESGEPLKGLRLISEAGFNAQSDANGQIRIANMFPGPFGWSVEAPEIARWWSEQALNAYERKTIEENRGGWPRNFDELHFQLAQDMAPVTIVAERGVRIQGRVLDPDGHPVAGATVAPALTGTGNSLTGDTRFSVRTDDRGAYNGLFPAGHDREWNLVAHDGDYDEWRRWANGSTAPFKTASGQQIRGLDLKLTRPVVVRGSVVDKNGHVVAHAEVRAVQADKRANRYYDPTTETDAAGRFQLRFVSPGRHFVQVAPFWLSAEEAPNPSSKTIEAQDGKPVDVGTLTQVQSR